MFVRAIKKQNDRVSLRIVESKRIDGKVKQKTVCGLGTAHKDDKQRIESLTRIGNQLIVQMKNEKTPALPGMEELTHSPKRKQEAKVSVKHLREEKRLNKGIEEVFGGIFNQLNLTDCISSGYKKSESNQLFKEIVLSRIASPSSKRKSVENLKRDNDLELDLDKVYRMMDKVYNNIDHIKSKICSATVDLFEDKVNVVFFDVTTLYFESFTPDALRVSGYSKDSKFKETQIMLSLITTTDGLPIGYEVFPGNSYEGDTLIDVIEKVEANYDIRETVIVADRAMFTKRNLSKLEEKQVKFIVAAKLKTMKKEYREEILSDVANALEANKALDSWSKDYEYKGRRLVVSYSHKRACKDKADRERLVERISTKMKDGKVPLSQLINNTGTKKFLKIDKSPTKQASLDQDKITQHARWDGIHGSE